MADSREVNNTIQHSRQYLRTDRDIRMALLALLDHQPFEKITVQDILDEAMINRSTFYQHYPDKYAVIEDLQRIYIDELDSIFRKIMEEARNDGRKKFSEMDRMFAAFFQKNRAPLRKLMKIRTAGMDIREETRQDLIQYFKGMLPPETEMTAETELEVSLIAGFYLDFLTYFIDHPELPEGYTGSMFHAFLNITRKFFRLESPEASRKLDEVIEQYALK